MARLAISACFGLMLGFSYTQAALAAPEPTHDRAFWLDLRARKFALPDGQPILPQRSKQPACSADGSAAS